MIHSHEELIVWQRSMELVAEIYKLTDSFPKEEVYGLTSQIRRAAVSIPSNIAEGRGRGTRKDFVQFLRIAFGSGAELQTQLMIVEKLPKFSLLDCNKSRALLDEVVRMLKSMIQKLNPRNPS